MVRRGKTTPPGKIKIMTSFSELMKQKDFNSITTAEIARNGAVTEGLIYKYFKDKRDLLYQVLYEHLTEFQARIETRVAGDDSCIKQLEVIIFSSLEGYADNRLLSKMIFLEARNSPEFFKSRAYAMIRKYAATILDIIKTGIGQGEIKAETDPYMLRKVILGAMEHACLGEVIFGRELDIDKSSGSISEIVFNGVRRWRKDRL